ncbi:MAG: HlyD family efflux transporter periplasmic adaptor subunit [Pseudomonadota bacterium]
MHQESAEETIPPAAGRRSYTRLSLPILAAAIALAGLSWYAVQPDVATARIGKGITAYAARTPIVHEPGGIVDRLLVREGQNVKGGDVLAIVDGAKVKAPNDGTVVDLKVRAPGDVLAPGDAVLSIVPRAVLVLEV